MPSPQLMTGNLEPIFQTFYSIYIDQNNEVVGQVRQKIADIAMIMEGGNLVKVFLRVKMR